MTGGVPARVLVPVTAPWAALTLLGWLSGRPLFALLGAIILVPLPALAYRSARAAGSDARGRLDLLGPLWIACGLFAFSYLLVPLLWRLDAQAMASLPGYLDMPASHVVPACALGGAAYVAFVLGFFSRAALILGRRLPQPGEPSARAVGALSLVLFVAGVASVAGVLAIVDGGTVFSNDLRARVTASYKGRGYLTVGFSLLMLSGPAATLWAARVRSRRAVVVAVAVNATALFLLGGFVGSRAGVLAVALGTLVVVHHRVRRVSKTAAVIAVAVLATAGVAQSVLRGSTDFDRPLSTFGTLASTLNGYEFLVNSLARVDHLEWGRPIAEDVLLTYVPRGLWTGKPEVYGFVREQEAVVPGLFDDFNRGAATFPVGLVAEGYINFGTFGAVGLSLLAGLLLAALATASRARGADYWLLLLAWTVPNLIGLMRGFGFAFVSLILGIAFFAPLLLAGRRARRDPPQGHMDGQA